MTSIPLDLAGMRLNNGWVLEHHKPQAHTTGGQCSAGYRASNDDGRQGFVKVLDIRPALESDDFSAAIKPLVDAFEYEKSLLNECSDIKWIITAIDDGQIQVNGYPIQYLVFNLADADARQQRELLRRFDGAWSLRTLHAVSAALEQLHTRHIAHQDLKPSNILIFAHGVTQVGDLGRSCHRDRPAPHESEAFPGDPRYTPPEHLYGYSLPDWSGRRRSTDLYLLGSLACFLVTGASMSDLIAGHRDPGHAPGSSSEPYAAIAPYLQHAQAQALDELQRDFSPYLDPRVSSRFREAIECLCHPLPEKRGHPRSHAQGDPYNLRRFVACFDLLAGWQEHFMRTIAPK